MVRDSLRVARSYGKSHVVGGPRRERFVRPFLLGPDLGDMSVERTPLLFDDLTMPGCHLSTFEPLRPEVGSASTGLSGPRQVGSPKKVDATLPTRVGNAS